MEWEMAVAHVYDEEVWSNEMMQKKYDTMSVK